MRPLISPAAMAEADRQTIEGGVPSEVLMERAGAAVASAARRLAGGAYGKRIVLVCGKGNNGGDGFVAARQLRAAGAAPTVIALVSPEELRGDARSNFHRLRGIPITEYSHGALGRELVRADVVVDAIVGTGLRGPLEGNLKEAADLINIWNGPVVAVDVPSGIDAATGRVESIAVRARVTLTMAAPKPGLVFSPGADFAGEIQVVDIGIPRHLLKAEAFLVTDADVAEILPPRPASGDKRAMGTVLVVAGSVGMAGAAGLVAKGALHGGAGLVTIAAPRAVAESLHLAVMEGTAIPLPETPEGTISADALSLILSRAEKVDALAIGPGLSTNDETAELVRKVVAQSPKPVVLDADGLNAFAAEPAALRSTSAPLVLTPHARELARLLDSDAGEIQSSRLEWSKKAAELTGATVLLKGRPTVVSEEIGGTYFSHVSIAGGPVLATGGTGDVLTGLIAALIAGNQRRASDRVGSCAWAGAWIHGRAAAVLAGIKGERGVLAGEVAEMIPDVIRMIASQPGSTGSSA